MTHIMLDLETWGTEPGCDIRSIGACVFDPVSGTVYGRGPTGDEGCHPSIRTMYEDTLRKGMTFYIACDNPIRDMTERFDEPNNHIDSRKYPLTRDPRTVQWWSEQSDAAQMAFADPVDLKGALANFTSWLYRIAGESGDSISQRTDIRLWSHGPAFDPPILAAAYRAVGLPVPWHYRAPRDTRTAFDMAGIDDHSAWLDQHPGPLGIPHHALDDSICQARAVCAAWKLYRVRNAAINDIVAERDRALMEPPIECTVSPDGRHQVDTSMESGPNNCFHCGKDMSDAHR